MQRHRLIQRRARSWADLPPSQRGCVDQRQVVPLGRACPSLLPSHGHFWTRISSRFLQTAESKGKVLVQADAMGSSPMSHPNGQCLGPLTRQSLGSTPQSLGSTPQAVLIHGLHRSSRGQNQAGTQQSKGQPAKGGKLGTAWCNQSTRSGGICGTGAQWGIHRLRKENRGSRGLP